MITEFRAWTFVAFIWMTAAPASFAQTPSEQAAINVMKQVERSWQQAIAEGKLLVRKCANDTWAASRLTKRTVVKMDLQRNLSVLSPYTGVIELSGSRETNSNGPRANGWLDKSLPTRSPQMLCYRSMSEAMAATAASDLLPINDGRNYDMRAEYSITADGAKLERGNSFFNNILYSYSLELPENAVIWANILRQPFSNMTPRSRLTR